MHASAEISLLIFTLLAQLAVGIVLTGQLALAGDTREQARLRIHKQGIFAFIFVAIAALISCFHLGTPIHAPYSIFNVATSWLSREILLALLTCISMGCMAYMAYRDPQSKWVGTLAIISCIVGLVFIYAMCRVYARAFLPNWDHASTFFLFLASSLILGALWQACALGVAKIGDGQEQKNHLLWRIFFLAVAGFILLAMFVPLSIPEPSALLNPVSVEATPDQIAALQSLHTLLTGLGILLFFVALWQNMRKRSATAWLFIGLLLALLGEIVGRYAFYLSYARLGM